MKTNSATNAQIAASDAKLSTWLTANAGSGKTKVLIDRVARLLLDGVQPEQILCLTYTKAAAAEMKNRLFEQQTPIAAEELRSIINPQVQIYIPEIEVKNIAIKDGGLQGHKLFVTVNYSMVNDESEDSVSLSFANENFQSNY